MAGCRIFFRLTRIKNSIWNHKQFQMRGNSGFLSATTNIQHIDIFGCKSLHTYPTKKYELDLKKHVMRNVFQKRAIFTSSVLLKKFKKEQYEKVQIFDPSGKFICSAELLILEAFCHHYNSFASVEIDPKVIAEGGNAASNTPQIQNGVDESGSKYFQLVAKQSKHDATSKVKEVKFSHKEMMADGDKQALWKLNKIKQFLINKGSVKVAIQGKLGAVGTKNHALAKSVIAGISGFSTVKESFTADNRFSSIILNATLTELDQKAFQSLLEEIKAREAPQIKIVHEMMETQSKSNED